MKQRQSPRNKPPQPRPATVRATAPAAAPVPVRPRTPLLHSRWMIALVAVFSFLIYSNTLKHEFANDDLASVSENRTILQGWGELGDVLTKANWYGFGQQNHSILRPITGLSFATDVQLFGEKNVQQSQQAGATFYYPNPHAMHLVNVVLYVLGCTVLFLALRLLLRGFHPLLPLAVALLFAAHPIHTEVVANIKSRDELLAFLFGLAVPLYLLLRYLEKDKPVVLFLAMVSYLLGVFSKESGVTFVAVFPLTLYFFTAQPLRRIALVSAPFVIPVVLFLAARAAWLDPAPADNRLIIDNVVFGATDAASKLATIAVIMLEYLRLLVFPHPLSWDYSYNQIPVTSLADPKALLSIAVHLALLVLAIMGLRHKKVWSYCIWFYFITMSVYSNLLVPIHATVGERFLFAPSLAFCLALAYGAFYLLGRAKAVSGVATAPAPAFTYAMVLVAILVTLYSFKTVARNKDWKDSITISRAGVEVSPNSARTHSSYGSALMKEGERSGDPTVSTPLYQEALAETKKAVEIYPTEANYLYNVGVLSYYLGDTATARIMFTNAVELEPNKLNALFNLASTYEKEGNNPMALKYFQRVQAQDSLFQNVTYHVGNSAVKQKLYHLALPNLLAHLRKFPDHADSYNALGVVYYEQQRHNQALEAFNRAVQLAPNRADIVGNAASANYIQQRYDQAAQLYEQALKLTPGNPTFSAYLNSSRQMAAQKR